MDDKVDRVRSNDAELDLDVELVCEMLIKAYSRTDIIRWFDKKKSIPQIDVYIKKAKISIKERFSETDNELTKLAFSRYEDLYKKNYQIQDYRECRQVQDSFNKLAGLFEKDNEQKSTKIEPITFKII
jgi:hypothetical protein